LLATVNEYLKGALQAPLLFQGVNDFLGRFLQGIRRGASAGVSATEALTGQRRLPHQVAAEQGYGHKQTYGDIQLLFVCQFDAAAGERKNQHLGDKAEQGAQYIRLGRHPGNPRHNIGHQVAAQRQQADNDSFAQGLLFDKTGYLADLFGVFIAYLSAEQISGGAEGQQTAYGGCYCREGSTVNTAQTVAADKGRHLPGQTDGGGQAQKKKKRDNAARPLGQPLLLDQVLSPAGGVEAAKVGQAYAVAADKHNEERRQKENT